MNKKLTIEYNGSYNQSFQIENNDNTIRTFIMTPEVCKNFIEQMKALLKRAEKLNLIKV